MHPNQSSNDASSRNGTTSHTDELGKIRDILFGAQSHEISQRITDLEEHFLKEAHEIRRLMDERFQSLETAIRQEVNQLRQALTEEANARKEAQLVMERSFRKVTEDIQTTMDEAFILHGNRLVTEAQQRQEAVTALTQNIAHLQSEKIDRKALSALLQKMAEALVQ